MKNLIKTLTSIFTYLTKPKGGAPIIVWLTLLLVTYNSLWHINKHAHDHVQRTELKRYWSDAEGYYIYIPALVNGSFKGLSVNTPGFFHYNDGKLFTKYTYPVALLESPLILILHEYMKKARPEEANFISNPYQATAHLNALLYGLLGLLFLFLLLNKRYTAFTSALVIFAIVFGTNFTYYISKDPGAVHMYAFFLSSLIFWFSHKYYETQKKRYWLLAAISCGLIAVMRPTNLIFFLVFFLWGVHSIASLKARIIYWKNRWYKVISFPFALVLLYTIQIALWYMMSGRLMLYSYITEGGFDHFMSPKILKVLFDFENGFFIYAPIMLFAIFGFIKGFKEKNHALFLFIFALMTYVFSSWWKWTFGGAFGYRPFIDFYPLFAFGLAYTFHLIFGKWHWLLQVVSVFIVGYFAKVVLLLMRKMPFNLYERPHIQWDNFWSHVKDILW